jgi:hypothetical protein
MERVDVSQYINEAASAHKRLTEETRKLSDKWSTSGLLEGLKGNDKQGMAVLLENQANQLLTENSYTNSYGATGENWAGVALPLVRKVFGQIASKNFVSVQPMNLPAGLVFYMDFKYNNTLNNQTAGGSVYGVTSGSGTIPTGGFYGAGRFGYTINDQNKTGLSITPSGSASAADVDFTGIATASLGIYEVTVAAMGTSPAPDVSAIRVFLPSGSGVNFGTGTLQVHTKLSADGSTIRFVAPLGGTLQSVAYVGQPTDSTRGDYEDTTGANLNIPELNLELRSEPIVAKTRKLKAVWSPELAQDLNAYHSVDAEAELTAMLSDYISVEIDLEILDMLNINAQTVDYWSTKIGDEYNPSTGAFAANSFVGTAWTNMTWYQTLGQKMQKVSNKIHQLTMRGGANFAVLSPTLATVVETIPGFTANTDGDKMEFSAGITKIGSYQSRWTIYKNPYMTENVIVMGFRGNNFLETGAVYAPYIPLIMTPLVYDPNNFTPRRGVMTRYAKKVVRPEFFGKIIVEGVSRI